MTTIRAQCPGCGDVQLKIDQLTVRVCDDDDAQGAYRFHCPVCAEPVQRPASPRIVGLLVSAGCRREVWHWPAELAEPRDGPQLTPDDLLDLHVMLHKEGWFDRLVSLVERTAQG